MGACSNAFLQNVSVHEVKKLSAIIIIKTHIKQLDFKDLSCNFLIYHI